MAVTENTSSNQTTSNTAQNAAAAASTTSQSTSTQSTASASQTTPAGVTFDANGFAQTAGIVKIYNYDGAGLFLGEEDYNIPAYTGVPANSTLTAPPTAPEGQVAVFDTTNKVWNLLADHRGTVIYDKKTGQQGTISQPGDIPSTVTTVAPTQPYSTWDDTKGAWEVNVSARSASLKLQAQAMMRVLMQAKNSNGWDPDINPMPDDVSAYAKALVAFIKETDTTSTALPATPAELEPFMSAASAS